MGEAAELQLLGPKMGRKSSPIPRGEWVHTDHVPKNMERFEGLDRINGRDMHHAFWMFIVFSMSVYGSMILCFGQCLQLLSAVEEGDFTQPLALDHVTMSRFMS